MDLKKIKVDFKDPATLCTLGGCVILLLASFLPIVKAAGITSSLMDGNHHGVVHIILIIAIAVLLVINQPKILSGVMTAEVVWCLWDMRSVASDVSDLNKLSTSWGGSKVASLQIAFYLLIIGALALIAGIVLATMNAKKSAPAQPAQPTQPMQ
jgi:hypothetical protein